MNPHEALQYLAQLAGDFARTLPASAQAPTVATANAALAALAGLLPKPEGDAEPE